MMLKTSRQNEDSQSISVSDFVAEFLIQKNIDTIMTISGGFSMTIQNSLSGSPAMKSYFQHHEAACGYAAVGYAKITTKPAVVLTTAGVAATNAISPCLVAYQDSLPVLFISGQVKSEETIRKIKNMTGTQLRHYSGADCDIISMVQSITKYAHEITCKEEVEEVFNHAFAAMTTGRKGPVWISFPLDIQGMKIIYPNKLLKNINNQDDIYLLRPINLPIEKISSSLLMPHHGNELPDKIIVDEPKIDNISCPTLFEVNTSTRYSFPRPRPRPLLLRSNENLSQNKLLKSIKEEKTIQNIICMMKAASRPLILAGGGIKSSNCEISFKEFVEQYNIPVVYSIHGTSLLPTSHPLSQGGVGILANRCGNFTIQNCDFLLCLGCRMSQAIIGYNPEWFAREARIIYIDNDESELEKANLNYTEKISMNLRSFLWNVRFPDIDNILVGRIRRKRGEPSKKQWLQKCAHWKNKWMNEMPDNYLNDIGGVNPYYTMRKFFEIAPKNKNIIVSSGTIITIAWHLVNVKEGDNFIISSQGDMGFELPAAIGATIANSQKTTFAILGEGSLQMNLQELQTIVYHKLPVKILLVNNGCHGSTQVTQTKFFGNLYGVNFDTGISFPDTEKICLAYGIKYLKARTVEEVDIVLQDFLYGSDGIPVLCEVFSKLQTRFPRLNARKNEDGTFSNRPFEDMEPFMSREELAKEMIIDTV